MNVNEIMVVVSISASMSKARTVAIAIRGGSLEMMAERAIVSYALCTSFEWFHA